VAAPKRQLKKKKIILIRLKKIQIDKNVIKNFNFFSEIKKINFIRMVRSKKIYKYFKVRNNLIRLNRKLFNDQFEYKLNKSFNF